MPDRSWTLLSSRVVSDHRIFTLREDRYRIAPRADERNFVVMDGPDWINIIPLTDEGQVVLVRQFRAPARGLGSTTGRWLRGSGLRSGLAVPILAAVCGSATVLHGCTATENRPFSSVNYCYRVRWAAWGYAVVP